MTRLYITVATHRVCLRVFGGFTQNGKIFDVEVCLGEYLLSVECWLLNQGETQRKYLSRTGVGGLCCCGWGVCAYSAVLKGRVVEVALVNNRLCKLSSFSLWNYVFLPCVHTCGSQRRTCGSWFSSLTVCVLGMECRFPWLGSKHLYWGTLSPDLHWSLDVQYCGAHLQQEYLGGNGSLEASLGYTMFCPPKTKTQTWLKCTAYLCVLLITFNLNTMLSKLGAQPYKHY